MSHVYRQNGRASDVGFFNHGTVTAVDGQFR